MVALRERVQRLLGAFGRGRADVDLQEELRLHAELAREAGRPAASTAHAMDALRDQRGLPWLDEVGRDVPYALRTFKRNPGFASTVVITLALGIGANTAMFSVVDAVLLKPLPFPEPERMVRVWETPRNSSPNTTTTMTFLDWKRQEEIFEALSVDVRTRAALATDGDAVSVPGKLVSADYFQVFDVRPLIGRVFVPGEDQPGAAPVTVLSHALWQTQFGADSSVLNRDVVLNGVPHKVIGVLPPGSFDRNEADFWKPLIFAPEQMNREQHWLPVVGRLRAGESLEQARAKMTALRASLAGVMPAWKKEWGFGVEPFAQRLVRDTLNRSIYLAFGAVIFVLLIACANVANLVLARGADRQKEMAVRAALGASRGRLARQLLAESLVLCLLGGFVGVVVANLLLAAAAPLVTPSLPFTADLSLDRRVLGFAAVAAMVAFVLTGLLPSLRTPFSRLSGSLNQAARGSSHASARVRRTVVIAEVAASVVLICGAALLLRSLARLQQVDAGVRIDHVVTMSADLPSTTYPTPQSAARFYEAVVEHLRAVPGVDQASVAQNLPLDGGGWGEGMSLPGVEPFGVGLRLVDPWYFATLQIPVESGRGIQTQDREGAPRVVVVNQELARRLSSALGGANPVGRTADISLPGYGPISESRVTVQIVGVIRSERTDRVDQPQRQMAYAPLAQVPRQDIKLIVHTAIEPLTAVSSIREAVRRVDPNLPLGDVRTMEQVKQQSMLWARQPTWVLGAFAAVGALLAALGLYGVLAYAVAQQRREIGILMALGARRADVLSHVLRNAFSLLIAGMAAGLAGAFALTHVLESLLFETSTLDPVALGVACLSMMLVGMLATWAPANRATRVDPMMVLRDDG